MTELSERDVQQLTEDSGGGVTGSASTEVSAGPEGRTKEATSKLSDSMGGGESNPIPH